MHEMPCPTMENRLTASRSDFVLDSLPITFAPALVERKATPAAQAVSSGLMNSDSIQNI